MAQSTLRCLTPSRPQPLSPHSSRPRVSLLHPCLNISASAQRSRLLVLRAMQPSGTGDAEMPKENAKTKNSDMGSARPPPVQGLPSFSLTNIPPWAKWVFAPLVLLALPFYKKFLRTEDEVEKAAETVLDVVEEVAEVTEKVSSEIADALPTNGVLKGVALKVEQVAGMVEKDSNLVESFIKKVDEVVDEVDAMIEPIIQEEIKGKNGQEEKVSVQSQGVQKST